MCVFLRISYVQDHVIVNRDSFLSFQSDAFVSLSCLIAVAGTSSTVVNRNGMYGHPCRAPDLIKKKHPIFYNPV